MVGEDSAGEQRAKEAQAPSKRPRRWHEGPLLLLTAVVVLMLALGTAFGFGLITRAAKSDVATGNGPSPTSPGPLAHSGSPKPSSSASSTSSATPIGHSPVAAGAVFTAIAGFGCPSRHGATFSEHGLYTQGISGFVKVGTGGWKGQGCNGTFDAMPMSGSATKPWPGIFALWTFRLASGLRCRVFVYVPNDHSIRHVGGNPAHYSVYDTVAPSGTPAGKFTVNEVANRGRWFSAGPFAAQHGVLTIELTNIGVDWTVKTQTYAHLAVASVRLSCAR